MPNIVFASNNIAHWPLSVSSAQAGTFDSNRVPYSLKLLAGGSITSPKFDPVSGEVSWVHHRVWASGTNGLSTDSLVRGFDMAGNLLFDVQKTFNTEDLLCKVTIYDGTTSASDEAAFPLNKSAINTVDIRYQATAGLINLQLYFNGGLTAEANLGANPSGFAQVSYITAGAAWSDSSPVHNVYFSEFIIADGDTRNARMDLLRPVVVGGESDWVGPVVNLADDDPTTGVTSIAAEERQTLVMSAYTGAVNVSSVVIATQSLAGANGPQNIRHTVRMGAVNYDGPSDHELGEDLRFNLTNFPINPATSVPWVGTDLATMEMGFVSKT